MLHLSTKLSTFSQGGTNAKSTNGNHRQDVQSSTRLSAGRAAHGKEGLDTRSNVRVSTRTEPCRETACAWRAVHEATRKTCGHIPASTPVTTQDALTTAIRFWLW